MNLLSVIIPVYKVEPYLHECVNSVLSQTFTNLEVILVDDGSPDACPAMCDNYARSDVRVRVVHQDNQGLSAARNAGLDLAKGDFIAFIDSDDYISPDYFEAAIEQFNSNPELDIVELPMISRFNTDSAVRLAPAETAIAYGHDDVFPAWFERQGYLRAYSQLKICRRQLFASLRFPVGTTFEDLHITPRLLQRARSIAFIAHPTANYFYRWRDESITGQARWHDLNSQVLALQEIAVVAQTYSSISSTAWAQFSIAATNILIDSLKAAKREGITTDMSTYGQLLQLLQTHKPSPLKALSLHQGWHSALKAIALSALPVSKYLRILS